MRRLAAVLDNRGVMQEIVVRFLTGNPLQIPKVAIELDGVAFDGHGSEWELGGPFAALIPGWKITIERDSG